MRYLLSCMPTPSTAAQFPRTMRTLGGWIFLAVWLICAAVVLYLDEMAHVGLSHSSVNRWAAVYAAVFSLLLIIFGLRTRQAVGLVIGIIGLGMFLAIALASN